MAGDLYTIEATGGQPTLVEAANILGRPARDLDAGFGVMLIDPRRKLYAVMLHGSASQASSDDQAAFANPAIDTFGSRQG